MCTSMFCDGLKLANKVGMVSRIFLLSTRMVATATMFLALSGCASWETQTEFTTFRFTSPGAHEILVPDTATMDEFLEILRSNNVPTGPGEILIDDGKGGQVVDGYIIQLNLITDSPGGVTNPHCPYMQTTTIYYGKDRRLQRYAGGVLPSCVE